MMRLSRDRASSAFVLAESIDSEESFPPASSPSYESSSYSSVSDIFSSSSISSSSSSSPSPSLSPSSQAVDENNLSSSTISNLWSSIFGPTSSTSISFSPSSMGSTTISSLLSSYSSSPLSTLPSSVETTTTTTTTTVTTSHHHHHHHSLTPFTPTLPTRIIDFGDKFLREEQRCVALVPETYDPVISTLCGLAVLIGLIYILAGYRLFRSVLFLTGFLIASSLVYGFIVLTSSPIPFYGTLIVSLSAGLLTGLVTFLVAWLGLFCLGFDLGSLIGTIIILSIHLLSPHVDTLSPPQSIWITFTVIAGWGIIGAFSTLYFQKGCTILATCMFGSAFVIAGLDYFVENFNLFNWFWANLKTNGNEYLMATVTRTASTSTGPDEPALFMCLISWILVMLWFILVSVGLFCQWFATGRGYYHSGTLTSSTSSRRNGTLDLVKIRAEESKTEQKQRKYRYLYQVRTAHGDVISQHYIQNFQKKLSPQMDHNDSLRTYNSDLSHLTSYNQSESRTTTMSHLP